jgi:chitinase
MPPGGEATTSLIGRKVIGYYEAWMARKSCHKMTPTDLPLDALTHVNFAFASIDPSTYQVVTMDSATPASLFKDTTNIKSIKADLSVYVSIGGWTFSDNGTATQPLFGEIAASEANRKKFANNVVHFMQQYGFDGVDIDWEYPGAGDRGGKPEDTENYVLLLKTMREVFDSSGGKYGLTFTAPSSYWYLRWFNLKEMVKYASWINVMTYDLHGVWDSQNPIGSIVQGHTNLTEIKSALELFWRVDINPSDLVLGFGFYGRSFTLADPTCSTPGCPFKGASDPGPCSDTGGMLAYYEIMSVLKDTSGKKRDTISPMHDKEAAVNYFTFDHDQWVSFDDETTFKQKVDWADTIGMGGAMIWASDLGRRRNIIESLPA